MSARPGFTISHQVPCDGGESPNAYKPVVTVEIRVHYPPRQVAFAQEVLERAIGDAEIRMQTEVSSHRRLMAEHERLMEERDGGREADR